MASRVRIGPKIRSRVHGEIAHGLPVRLAKRVQRLYLISHSGWSGKGNGSGQTGDRLEHDDRGGLANGSADGNKTAISEARPIRHCLRIRHGGPLNQIGGIIRAGAAAHRRPKTVAICPTVKRGGGELVKREYHKSSGCAAQGRVRPRSASSEKVIWCYEVHGDLKAPEGRRSARRFALWSPQKIGP